MPVAYPDYVDQELRNIREDFELRWNPKAVLVKAGSYDATGKLRDPVYEPRFELWDRDPNGRDYRVMRLQHPDGSFRAPGQWLITHLQKINPARYGGNLERMLRELEEHNTLKEVGTIKDSDDLIEAASNWAAWHETPKSGAALTYRGKRLLSA